MPCPSDRARIFFSAGEASGDMYAAWTLQALKARLPEAECFGCAGPRLRAAGCEAMLESERIAMVGLAEVVTEIPRVWRDYRALLRKAFERRPDVAILVDAPDFNLRLARHFKRQGVPVLYLVAPQAWAWRPWRANQVRNRVDRLACIFPFEEPWFRERGVNAVYVGHPLSGRVKPSSTREQFFARHALDPAEPLLALLPGSRRREAALNLPRMAEAAGRVNAQSLIAVPDELPVPETGLLVIRGETYDAVAHSDVALVASGTATIETALLGTPMVVVYRVTEPTWLLGRLLVRTRFYSMVNLVAERAVVPELIQDAFTAERAGEEVSRLLESQGARRTMQAGLAEVAGRLAAGSDPMGQAAEFAVEMLHNRRNESARQTAPPG